MLKAPLLTSSVKEAILEYLSQLLGSDFRRAGVRPSGAGCINETYEIYGQGIDSVFVKVGSANQLDMYEKEARGLELLRQCEAIRVPTVYGSAVLDKSAILALEFIALSPVRSAQEARFGAALAQLHSIRGQGFGLGYNNYIGRTHQINDWAAHDRTAQWWPFYVERRLLPQCKLAQMKGMRAELIRQLERLMERIPERLLDHAPQPVLVHGDLWSGNMAVDQSGMPTLFDPAVYFGDAETDLAMIRMFGSPGAGFFAAYHSILPQKEGHELRRNLYDLYHWLNHFNLFGVGYLGQVEVTLDTLINELS